MKAFENNNFSTNNLLLTVPVKRIAQNKYTIFTVYTINRAFRLLVASLRQEIHTHQPLCSYYVVVLGTSCLDSFK